MGLDIDRYRKELEVKHHKLKCKIEDIKVEMSKLKQEYNKL